MTEVDDGIASLVQVGVSKVNLVPKPLGIHKAVRQVVQLRP